MSPFGGGLWGSSSFWLAGAVLQVCIEDFMLHASCWWTDSVPSRRMKSSGDVESEDLERETGLVWLHFGLLWDV
eukprot:124559-Amphidinium_carterae.1